MHGHESSKRKRVKASRFWCLLKFLWFARLLSFMIKYYKQSMRDSKLEPSVRYLTLAGRQFNLYPFISSNPKQRTMLSLSYMGPKKRSGGEDTSTWGSVVWRTRWKPAADLQYTPTHSVPLSLSFENRAPLTIPVPERQTQWDGGSM